MELSFSGTSWEVNDFKQNFGPFSGTELVDSTVVVIAGFWSGVVGFEPEHSGVQNICFFSSLVPPKREKNIIVLLQLVLLNLFIF